MPTDKEDREITKRASKDGTLLSDKELEAMKPASEFPAIMKALKKGRGTQKAPIKKQVTLRLDSEVDEYFRSTGKGWQGRLSKVLKRYVEDEKKKSA